MLADHKLCSSQCVENRKYIAIVQNITEITLLSLKFFFTFYETLVRCDVKAITLFAVSQLQSYFGLEEEFLKGQQIQFTFALLNICCERREVRGQRACLFLHSTWKILWDSSSQFGHNCFLPYYLVFRETRQKLDIIFPANISRQFSIVVDREKMGNIRMKKFKSI